MAVRAANRLSAAKGDFSSVLAVRHPAPALAPGDTIVLAPLLSQAGWACHCCRTSRWRRGLAISTSGSSGWTTSSPVRLATVPFRVCDIVGGRHRHGVERDKAEARHGNTTTRRAWLLVADGAGDTARKAVKVVSVVAGIATVDAPLPAATLRFMRLPHSIIG